MKLTDKEEQIARLVGERLTNEQIAEVVGLATSTIQPKLSMIYMKLGLNHREELARLYGADPREYEPAIYAHTELSDFYWKIIHAVCAKRMTIEQAAEFLGYHETTIYACLRQIYSGT